MRNNSKHDSDLFYLTLLSFLTGNDWITGVKLLFYATEIVLGDRVIVKHTFLTV